MPSVVSVVNMITNRSSLVRRSDLQNPPISSTVSVVLDLSGWACSIRGLKCRGLCFTGSDCLRVISRFRVYCGVS